MATGTAVLILSILYLARASGAFRQFCLGVVVVAGVGAIGLIFFGADKPQTIFYNSSAHPAFLMRAGDSCPGERHVWNGWCVK